MDYLKIYNSIIKKAISENRKRYEKTDKKYVYYEKHHIIPICLGGEDKKENIVLLTAKEHYISHKLLFLIYGGSKLACALHRMTYSKRYNKYLSSRDYAYAKKIKSETPIEESTRIKMRDAKIGKKREAFSEDHKKKIRSSNLGWKHSPEVREKMRNIQKGPRPYRRKTYILISPEGKKYSIETRKKLYEFIKENNLSQRKIFANINKGSITEENFQFLKETSKKTLRWEIQKI